MRVSFVIPPGVVGDDTDFSNPGWADASGMRFWRDLPETIPGWERLSSTDLTGTCRTIFQWTDGDGLQSIAFGLHNGLTVWQAGDQASITPSSGFTAGQINGAGGSGYGTGAYGIGDYGEPSTDAFFPLTWSFGARSFGELYANPRGQGIFKWENNTATPAATLTNAPAQCTFMLVASTDQVVALGCTDVGGTFNAACVRFSDAADPTIWTPGTANTAQQFYLQGNGRIVGARLLQNAILIWTTSELHVATFGGDGWSIERIASNCGLAGPNAAIVVGLRAFWVTPDLQFYTYAFGGTAEVLECPIRDDFADNAADGQNDKIVATMADSRGDIMWLYADQRDGEGLENSRAIRLSTVMGAWCPDMLPRTAYVGPGPSESPIGVTSSGVIYWHDRGNSADGAALTPYIETGGQYIDPAQRRMLVRGMWPDFKSQTGAVFLKIWTREYPQSEEVEHGPFTCAVGQERVDFMVSGRVVRFRLYGNSSPCEFRLGKPSFDVVPLGER